MKFLSKTFCIISQISHNVSMARQKYMSKQEKTERTLIK